MTAAVLSARGGISTTGRDAEASMTETQAMVVDGTTATRAMVVVDGTTAIEIRVMAGGATEGITVMRERAEAETIVRVPPPTLVTTGTTTIPHQVTITPVTIETAGSAPPFNW